MIQETQTYPHCSGIIVFNNDKTILVMSHHGNYSFPKGKMEKGEIILDTAWRELNEETGLTKDYVQLIDENYIDEISQKGNIIVRYYVGKLIKETDESAFVFTFDPEELSQVIWINVEEAYNLPNLRERRKDILKMAYERYMLEIVTND